MDKFIFYKDWWKAISNFPDDMQLKAYNAICEFVFEGVEPSDPMIYAMTYVMCAAIMRDKRKYETARKKREAEQKSNVN